MALNCIQIMGRLTKNVDLRRTNDGTAVASFTIAVDDNFRKDKTIFVNIVAWRKTAEFCNNYFSKGRMIIVSGRLDIREWEDKNGNKRTTPEVIAENVYFGDSKKNDGGQTYNGGGQPYSEYAVMEDDDAGLPF